MKWILVISASLLMAACGSKGDNGIETKTAISEKDFAALPGVYEKSGELSATCKKIYLAYTITAFKVNQVAQFMRANTGENIPLFASPKTDYLTGVALPIWNPICPTFPDCSPYPTSNVFSLHPSEAGVTLKFESECEVEFKKIK